jgi:argininosuccinate lyase
MGESHTSGSSIMPQKRNPDAAELVRGKSGRVIGSLNALLTMVKGLPLAYNRDLQEDREALFDAVETTIACTRICASIWRELTVYHDRYEGELEGDFLLATEIADYLVTKGVPFREAHRASGQVVAHCEARGLGLDEVADDQWSSFHPDLDVGVRSWLEPRAAAERRSSYGGTASVEIQRQVDELHEWLGRS